MVRVIEKVTFMVTATAATALCYLMYTGQLKILQFGENMWVVSLRPFH